MRPLDRSTNRLLLLILILLLSFSRTTYSFNIDIYAPIYKYGPNSTYFGYTVAEHFKGKTPIILVGAPRAESGQLGTKQAGALYACPINTYYSHAGDTWCEQVRAEYEDPSAYARTPDKTPVLGKTVHYHGKDGELLGASLASQGIVGGGAVVCAPLMRYHNSSAYAQGSCYELDSQLNLKSVYTTCQQKNLPKTDRHNEYGACMEGFSTAMTENTVVTGAVGARKWTGGVYAKWSEGSDIFGKTVEKYTMAHMDGIRTMLTSHDYLGYSVDVGKFGFWYETDESQTVVSGATRSGQHGAVIFLPFTMEHGSSLVLTEDRFVLNGTKLGSAFGYAIEVMDINNDGFDDLIVSAPFEHRSDKEGHFGGIVYVYFSQGVKRNRDESHLVFYPPVVLKGPAHFSQFGLSITKLGNLDGDSEGLNDFAIGAPYANGGVGAVYIYLGAKSREEFRKKPAQIISGSDLPKIAGKPMKSFGFSVSGGSDLDGNGYPDLVVGAVQRGIVTVLRSRPVISISTIHRTPSKFIDIEKAKNCPRGAKTCFPLDLQIFVDRSTSKGADLVDFNSNVFTCNLEIVPFSKGVSTRGLIEGNHSHNMSWPCGQGAHRDKQTYTKNIYIPSTDESNDWINPLKFKFTVKIKNERRPTLPSEGRPIVDLKQYPVLNKYGARYEFEVAFNTRCGDDQVCQTDLRLEAAFAGIPRTDKGYIMNVGDKDHLDITFAVENKGEKAYQSALFLTFDPEELELPHIPGKTRLLLETVGKKTVVVHLGNPMNSNKKHQFDVRFKLVRGRTEGIGRPLRFNAIVNSTSEETNIEDNSWTAEVQIIKKAEIEIIGTSDPPLVRYGGEIRGASSMDLEEDIGVMIRHNYTIQNLGPWTVRNVKAQFEWPYQVESDHIQGKWALYLLDMPTITTHNTDGTTEIRRCSMEQKLEYVNPIDHIKLNTKYTTQETQPRKQQKRLKRSAESDTTEADMQHVESSQILSAGYSADRIKPQKRLENGYEVNVVTISCADKTAKCFTVTCQFDFLDANSAPVIDFRARLWNSTFVEDYYDVEYVEILSLGQIILDANQGIEDDPTNNVAKAKTVAYPDRPAIGDSRPIAWWIIAVSIAVGLLILALVVLCLWKCGFFKRKRVGQPSLYQAELMHEREQWAQSRM